MKNNRAADFFIAGMIPLVLLAALQIPDYATMPLLVVSIPAYGLAILLDVRSTASFGRAAVGCHERAAVFRLTTNRFGFAVAIPVQVSLEMLLALLAVPHIIFGWSIQSVCGSLLAFSVLHLIGWRYNLAARRLDFMT